MTDEGSLKLGVTFHSFTSEYTSYVWSFEDLMEHAAKLGGGVEIVGPAHHRGFPHVPDEFEAAFTSSVVRHRLTPTSYGSYADPFLRWDRELNEDELVQYTLPQIRGAARLGFPIVRLQHYAAEIVERVLPTAEDLGVVLAYELHTPLDLNSERTQFLVAQIERIGSPHLGLIPDAGLFARSVSAHQLRAGLASGLTQDVVDEVVALWRREAAIEEAEAMLEERDAPTASAEWAHGVWGGYGHSDPADLAEIAALIVHVHAKFYSMQDGDEPDLRYRDLVFALLDIGYEGWISSEYEGPPADSFQCVWDQQRMIRRYVHEYNAAHSVATEV
jgi:sugar phosphate isomerase/epimerase